MKFRLPNLLPNPKLTQNNVENLLDLAEHKKRWALLSEFYGKLFKPERRYETFDEAVERLELTPEKLQTRRRELIVESRLCYAFAFLMLISGIGLGWNLFSEVMAVLVSVAFILNGISRAVRVQQIDTKTLSGVDAWIRNSEYWFV